MNVLKRLILGVGALLLSVGSMSAQFDDLRYRVEVGGGASKISNYGTGRFLLGLRLSGQVMLPFEDSKFSLHSGLTLVNKGENSTFFNQTSGKVQTVYLQVPVEASFRVDINDDNKFYVALGPYFGYGLSGKITGTNEKLFSTMDGYENPAFKRFEFGLGFNLAYMYSDFYLKLGYETSLSSTMNLSGSSQSERIAGGSPKHGQFYIGLGYQF